MTIDPQVQGLLDNLKAQGVPDFADMGVEATRGFIGAFIDFEGPAQDVAQVRDVVAPGKEGQIPLRIYRPSEETNLPVILYFHGGGYVGGTVEIADKPCRQLANVTGAVVVSVEYRLAPEHKAPAAAEDCYAATAWVAENGADLGVDPARLAVCGDSAGGGLAAAVPLMARDRGGPAIAMQILIYPLTDLAGDYPSRVSNGEGYLLSGRALGWFGDHYMAGPADIDNPYLAPIRAADHSGLPRAVVITAGYDPLRDEGDAYAAKLAEAGVDVLHLPNPSMIHGFMWLGGLLDHTAVVFEQLGEHVRENL